MSYLEDEWAVKNKHFRLFREKYRAYVQKCEQSETKPTPFSGWQVRPGIPNTETQKNWQRMDNTVWSVNRATLDGVLFRTRVIQDKKKRRQTTPA